VVITSSEAEDPGSNPARDLDKTKQCCFVIYVGLIISVL
jgi:hypothetical protein